MGIQIEFNPDLALRRYNSPNKNIEECVPEHIERERAYKFLKRGQRNYWLEGELALVETEGGEKLSAPKASIKITEATHFKEGDNVYTKGKYKVVEVFTDDQIHFNWLKKI